MPWTERWYSLHWTSRAGTEVEAERHDVAEWCRSTPAAVGVLSDHGACVGRGRLGPRTKPVAPIPMGSWSASPASTIWGLETSTGPFSCCAHDLRPSSLHGLPYSPGVLLLPGTDLAPRRGAMFLAPFGGAP